MGGLFSSNKQEEENRLRRQEQERLRSYLNNLETQKRIEAQWRATEQERQRQRLLEEQLFRLSLEEAGARSRLTREEQLRRQLPRNIEQFKVKTNPNLLRNLTPLLTVLFQGHSMSFDVNTITLNGNSSEYLSINRLFKNSNKGYIRATEIMRIDNIYLMAAYILKTEQFVARYGSVEEKLMFHGTKSCNIAGIYKNNFNWRLFGTGTGHKFGRGVSFSPIAFYATHYSDKRAVDKKMLLVRVMFKQNNACLGNKGMLLPVNGCDASTNDNQHVFVKYEDNEFYPAYIINYRVGNKNI